MSTKVITVWLILLTAWTVYSEVEQHSNLEIRNSALLIRKQKVEDIDANLKSLEKFINDSLVNKMNEIGKYSHKH